MAKSDRSSRSNAQNQQLCSYIAPGLEPLVRCLIARYPGVRIERADMSKVHGDGWQSISYRAPWCVLRREGLLTSDMVARARSAGDGVKVGTTSLGDRYTYRSVSRDNWELAIATLSAPWERERFSTKQAAGVLRRIARQSLVKQ